MITSDTSPSPKRTEAYCSSSHRPLDTQASSAHSNTPPTQLTPTQYVAGKPRTVNKLIANVRHGPSRPQALWDDVCTEINALWASLVGNKGEKELRAIFIMGGMIGGSEAGFAIPKAGEDGMWMRENLEGFRRKAEGGDVEFEELVEAAEKLNGVEGGKGVNGANGSNGA